MGNNFLKDYSLSNSPISSIGYKLLWKIYKGKKINFDNNFEVSIWILTKEFLRNIENKIIEQIFYHFKKELTILTDLSKIQGMITIYEVILSFYLSFSFSLLAFLHFLSLFLSISFLFSYYFYLFLTVSFSLTFFFLSFLFLSFFFPYYFFLYIFY